MRRAIPARIQSFANDLVDRASDIVLELIEAVTSDHIERVVDVWIDSATGNRKSGGASARRRAGLYACNRSIPDRAGELLARVEENLREGHSHGAMSFWHIHFPGNSMGVWFPRRTVGQTVPRGL